MAKIAKLEDYYLDLSVYYEFVQVVGTSGKLYSRNYNATRGSYDYDNYPVVATKECNNQKTLCITVNDQMPYKLHVYMTKGTCKGDIDHKEYFTNRNDMIKRYIQLYDPKLNAYRPTAWELQGNNEYTRLAGY